MNAALELALRLIRAFEGCRLRAYRDSVNIWTVCYGFIRGVTADTVKTQPECEALLASETTSVMLRVLKLCPELAPYPARLAAVTSFAYNLGLGALAASTLKRKIRRKDWTGAGAEFPKWRFAGGRELRGLAIRRALERKTFESG